MSVNRRQNWAGPARLAALLVALMALPQVRAETAPGDAVPTVRPLPRSSVDSDPDAPAPASAAQVPPPPVFPVALPVLALPGGARLSASMDEPEGLYPLPIGPAMDMLMPHLTLQGGRSRRAWTVPVPASRLFEDLAGQIAAAGYEIRLRCTTAACGGFDFRAGLDLLPPPGMYVDLAEFHALTATREGPDGKRALFLLVSPRGGGSTCQIDVVGPPLAAQPSEAPVSDKPVAAAAPSPRPVPDAPLVPASADAGEAATAPGAAPRDADALSDRLARDGHVVLDGVRFASGSAVLDGPPPPALTELADALRSRPDLRVTIVGHSDASGNAAANLDLSRRRAEAVAEALTRDLGVRRAQLAAAGAGQLAPRASNATPEGRALNRRVEAVLLPD